MWIVAEDKIQVYWGGLKEIFRENHKGVNLWLEPRRVPSDPRANSGSLDFLSVTFISQIR